MTTEKSVSIASGMAAIGTCVAKPWRTEWERTTESDSEVRRRERLAFAIPDDVEGKVREGKKPTKIQRGKIEAAQREVIEKHGPVCTFVATEENAKALVKAERALDLAERPIRYLCERLEVCTGVNADTWMVAFLRRNSPEIGLRPYERQDGSQKWPDLLYLYPKLDTLDRDGTTTEIVGDLLRRYPKIECLFDDVVL